MSDNGFDSFGIQGSIFHFSMVFALVTGTFITFLVLWKKGRLDMNEEPSKQMMGDDDG